LLPTSNQMTIIYSQTTSTMSSPLKTPDILDESAMFREEEVAITGISCRLPNAQNMTEFVQNLTSTTGVNTSRPQELKGKN